MEQTLDIPRAQHLDADPYVAGGGSRETVWENPTDKDIILPLHCGSQATYGKFTPSYMQRYGIMRVVVPAKSKVTISSDYDMAIQDTHCREGECTGKARECRHPKHRKTIIAGLGPHLINKGMILRPEVHPSLDAHNAEYKRSIETLKETEEALMRVEAERRKAISDLERVKSELAAQQKMLASPAVSTAVSNTSDADFVPPPKK